MAYRLVLVEWRDSAQPIPVWQWADDFTSADTPLCVSVGYLIAETADALALAPNLGDVHGGSDRLQVSGVIRIPVSSVCLVRELTPVVATAKA